MFYIIGEKDSNGNTSGSKARVDAVKIVKDKLNGVELNWFRGSRLNTLLFLPYYLLKSIVKIKKGDIIISQYPYYCRIDKFFIKLIKFIYKKRVNVITIIHDINSLRYDGYGSIEKEINILNMSDKLISHNKHMTKWLKMNNISAQIEDLYLFDYIMNNHNISSVEFKRIINYAGNLTKKKSGFIYKLENLDLVEWNIYGPNYEGDKNNKLYKGVYPPEELSKVINKGFGLIWDGNSIYECDGDMGKYLKYNNPHKLSLYIACGIPVITWSKSAIADFIKENNIGFVINNINDINDVLGVYTDEEYKNILNNVKNIQSKVISGEYLYDAIVRCIK